MLTLRENFIETVTGGHPDRFVNQYAYMGRIADPIGKDCNAMCARGSRRVNAWGATIVWPEALPGPFPIHDEEHIVLKDITQWKQILRRPDPRAYPEELWKQTLEDVEKARREGKFVTCSVTPGILERVIMLMSISEGLMAFLEEPEAAKELVDFLADWEIACAQETLRHYQPEILFHHDDWGSQKSLLMSVPTFEKFLLPAYKKIYGFWKENGVRYVIHHSDSYAAELVPHMIEMGVDIWQGAVSENNLPELIRKYGDRITFQAGLDNGKYDTPDWSREAIREGLENLFQTCGTAHLIPSLTQGGPGSAFPGVYETVTEVIDELSEKYF